MPPRNLVFITLLALCHLQLAGQTLTNALPLDTGSSASPSNDAKPDLPDDPGQELLPIAEPEPQPPGGVPVQFEADRQTRVGDLLTLDGHVVVHYRTYILRADKVVYHQVTSVLEAEGHLQLEGGPNGVLLNASHGDMRLNMHTARFYNVTGSQGLHNAARSIVYSTSTPFQFTARVLLQTGDDKFRIIDGTMTNCTFPHPDWQIIARAINLDDREASTKSSVFKLLGVPVFYLPFLRHEIDDTGRTSGFLIPVLSNSSIKGFIVGEQVYWVINRSMDMVVGAEYFSKRGYAPNGDFRYKGRDIDHLIVRWNALIDRGVQQEVGNTITTTAARATPTFPKLDPARISLLAAAAIPGPPAMSSSIREASTWWPRAARTSRPISTLPASQSICQLSLPPRLQRQLLPGHQFPGRQYRRPHLRPQRIHPLCLARPVRDLRRLHQRQRSPHPSLAQRALRCA